MSVGRCASACCLELDHKLVRHPAAVSYLNTLALGPFTNLGRARSAGTALARGAAARPPGGPANPPPGADILRQGLAQLRRMGRAEVDLVLCAVQPKADRPFRIAPVDVIYEERLYLLRHEPDS